MRTEDQVRDDANLLLGFEDTKNLIMCLHKNGAWQHSIPEN